MNSLVIPLAGFGKRFLKEGYTQTKPLIHAGKKTIIEWALSSVEIDNDTQIIFVVREDQCIINGLDAFLKKICPKSKIVKLNQPTRGSLETVLMACNEIDLDGELFIHTSDICLPVPFNLNNRFKNNDINSFTVTFKANNPAYSYCKLKPGTTSDIEFMIEKEVVSQLANVGIYGFRSASDFIEKAKFVIKNNILVKDEFYISSVFSLFFEQKALVLSCFVDEVHIIGTPNELDFFSRYVWKTMNPKNIGFVSDHSGFSFKEKLRNLFEEDGYITTDFGCFSLNDCDYSDYVPVACQALNNGEVDMIIGSCISGQGVNISANHCKNIISVNPSDADSLAIARKHNCPNFISFASKNWDPLDSFNAFKLIYSDKIHFEGGRHSIRIQKALINHEGN